MVLCVVTWGYRKFPLELYPSFDVTNWMAMHTPPWVYKNKIATLRMATCMKNWINTRVMTGCQIGLAMPMGFDIPGIVPVDIFQNSEPGAELV